MASFFTAKISFSTKQIARKCCGKIKKIAHNCFMRLSATACLAELIFLGVCGGVYAFTGFNLLKFICFGNITAVRVLLGTGFVSALFCLYALIAFKPFRGLK